MSPRTNSWAYHAAEPRRRSRTPCTISSGWGIASNDTVLTAFVHTWASSAPPASASRRQSELETALIAHMREAAPELDKGETASLHLRVAAQVLRDEGLADPLPLNGCGA